MPSAEQRTHRIINGRCTSCGRERRPSRIRIARNHDECWRCFFVRVSIRHTGSAAMARELAQLFLWQHQLCAYTGMPLILGLNASLDHVRPISQGGETTLINLRWTTKQLNLCKSGMCDQEFLRLCLSFVDFVSARKCWPSDPKLFDGIISEIPLPDFW